MARGATWSLNGLMGSVYAAFYYFHAIGRPATRDAVGCSASICVAVLVLGHGIDACRAMRLERHFPDRSRARRR